MASLLKILIGVTMAPSISLTEGSETIMRLERRIVKYGEVEEIISRIGRPEAGSHPHPVNYAEVHIELKPLDEWPKYKTKQELIAALSKELSAFPGVQLNFTQPIQNAFDELLSGIRAQLAIKLWGRPGRLAEKVRGNTYSNTRRAGPGRSQSSVLPSIYEVGRIKEIRPCFSFLLR